MAWGRCEWRRGSPLHTRTTESFVLRSVQVTFRGTTNDFQIMRNHSGQYLMLLPDLWASFAPANTMPGDGGAWSTG